jgi:hypothetical protein
MRKQFEVAQGTERQGGSNKTKNKKQRKEVEGKKRKKKVKNDEDK